MQNIMLEIFNEAASHSIVIDNDIFNIGFNTIIYNNNKIELNTTINDYLPTLIIKNKELFYSKL